jgi:RNA polymerase sigma-70 factor (ECF subfamily)
MDALSQSSSRSASLLGEARAGNTASFWQLAESYRPYLKAVASRVLGTRLAGQVDASDVVQEGLALAFSHFADFRGQDVSQWQGWVLAIVKSQAQRQLRYWQQDKRNVHRQQPLALGSSGELQFAAKTSDPALRASGREQTARLLALIDRLPPDYQEVLQLRSIQDLPYAEVAARMQRSEGAVRVLWARAVRRLRDDWGEQP